MASRMRSAIVLDISCGRGCKGASLIFDCVIACVIIIVGLAAYSSLVANMPPELEQGLGKYATYVLTFLDSKGCLARLIEGRNSLAMQKTIGELIPDGMSYCLCVYSPYWELNWSFASQGFDWRNAAASSPYLVSSESNPEPYLVTLAISK